VPDVDELLLARQDGLQAEAALARADLRLDQALSEVGRPVLVGSAGLGLMVRRDLDITVVTPALDLNSVLRLGARMANHPRVREVVFRNDTGGWNLDLGYPDGLYLGLRYRSPAGKDWTIDLWFVDEPDRQPDLAHLRTLSVRLTSTTRSAILRIKDSWWNHPKVQPRVCSYDIYSAVPDGDVRTVDQFVQWLARRPD
jgi:hypothetical protein